jgi:uncharacterized Rmd1/YagE family protein
MKANVQEIRRLSKEGKSKKEISEIMGISYGVVIYWLSEDIRKKRIVYAKEYFNKKSDEEKKEIYKSRKEYIRNYSRNRYKNDPIFRDILRRRAREWKQKKN